MSGASTFRGSINTKPRRRTRIPAAGFGAGTVFGTLISRNVFPTSTSRPTMSAPSKTPRSEPGDTLFGRLAGGQCRHPGPQGTRDGRRGRRNPRSRRIGYRGGGTYQEILTPIGLVV